MSNIKLRNFNVQIKDKRIGFKSEHSAYMFKKFLEQFEGKDVWLTIDERIPKRTEQQNRYYHLYLSIIADETGDDKNSIHAWAKGKFLTQDITEIFGDKVRITKSTTELSKTEFAEYIQKIEQETGIPSPDTTPFQLSMTHDEFNDIKNGTRK